MRHLILFVVLILPLVSRAAFVVDDPKHVLADLATWEHPVPFEKAMTCGQNTTIDFTTLHCDLKCTTRWCASKCEKAHDPAKALYGLHVDECSPDLVHVFGDNGLIIEVPKAEYVAGGQTYVLSFLKNIGIFLQPEGTITIERWSPSGVTMIDNGQMKSLHTYQIHGTISYGDPAAQTQGFDLEVTDQLDGIRQILMFSMNQDVFFRVHGVVTKPWEPPPMGGF